MADKLIFSDKKFDYKSLFLLTIGLCPTLAVTTSVKNSFIIGVMICSTAFFSNIITKAFEKSVPEKIKSLINIIIIMGIVIIISMILEGYFLKIYKEFGIYLPLIGINSIFMRNNFIFKNKESFTVSLKYEMILSVFLTILLLVTGFFRELLGNGSIFGINLFGEKFLPALILLSPAGALITAGFILALVNVFVKKIKSIWKVGTNEF